MINLAGKTALVTGAARRIGASICRSLHASGANVVIHYSQSADDAVQLMDELNGLRANSARCISADLRDLASLKKMHKEAQAAWDGIDILINNASRFYPTPVTDFDEAEWLNLSATNIQAPLFLTQAFSQHCHTDAREGVIINLVDIHGLRPLKNYSLYSMTKSAMAMLTYSMAKELAPQIRVNGVSPGAIMWPENQDDAEQEEVLQRIPMQRAGEAQDIAEMVLFLVSDKANYITGQVIAVDGGRSLSQ